MKYLLSLILAGMISFSAYAAETTNQQELKDSKNDAIKISSSEKTDAAKTEKDKQQAVQMQFLSKRPYMQKK